MEKKLSRIFSFLSANRSYNRILQEKNYRSVILPYDDTKDKIAALLYNVANSQSQPRINNLAEFYRMIYQDDNCMDSMKSFLNEIYPNKPLNFNSLFMGMKKQDGWGPKTAALFAKSIFQLHSGQYPTELEIWRDVPAEISKHEDFYLPVDAVIIEIFKKLDSTKNWNFYNINSKIKDFYKGQQIEVWDDLWFWGFITQVVTSDKDKKITWREHKWNENKYWALKETEKDKKSIEAIKVKAEEFVKYLST